MRTWWLPLNAVALGAMFVAALRILAPVGDDASVLSNCAQLVAASLASAGCLVASRRGEGRRRDAWRWLAAGTACWALGQAAWSFYEVIQHHEVPFPSLADAGYLAFPILGGIGLSVWPTRSARDVVARARDVMDGAIIAMSLLALSWVTVMASQVRANDESGLLLALSLAYPVGDVVLGTLVLLTLSRTHVDRAPLVLLGSGLGAFTLADSFFWFHTSAGTYSSTELVTSGGWVTGFLVVAAAGVVTCGPAHRAEPVDAEQHDRRPWIWVLLPYMPLPFAGVALCSDLLSTDPSTRADLLLGAGLVTAVLVRQFLTIADNRRLLKALTEASARLRHLATHDPLTGLANRTLFAERLDHALDAATSNVSVLFCDLDDFKSVNDELGHVAGDQLLKSVAGRLSDCVGSDGTVARVGGDEFAVVLVDCPDPQALADRIGTCLSEEIVVQGRAVRPSMSIGLAQDLRTPVPTTPAAASRPSGASLLAGTDRRVAAEHLVRMADTAMYAAKAGSKSSAGSSC